MGLFYSIRMRSFDARLQAMLAKLEDMNAEASRHRGFAMKLTEERVAVVPGSTFGGSGRGYIRVCYAASYEDLEEAMDRIERFVTRRRAGEPAR